MVELKFVNDKIDEILQADKVVIFGAGLMGRSLLKCLQSDTYNRRIEAFIVSERKNNPSHIEGIEVIDIQSADKYLNALILVTLHEKHVNAAINGLKKRGFANLLPITFDSDLWTDLRGNWMYDEGIGINENTTFIDSFGENGYIYVVHCSKDKMIRKNEPDRIFERSILVGADISDANGYYYKDNSGDNISLKNKEYCELTALYWIWKNDDSPWAGICHYRRKFEFDENDSMNDNDIDIIVTVPVINVNTVRGQYLLDHNIDDWNKMMEAISKLYPEYLPAAKEVQDGCYYYAYNMFITRREIMNRYCEWLFNILKYCEKETTGVNDVYQNRYVGFLAERLLTIYIVHHKFKIGIARKRFFESE